MKSHRTGKSANKEQGLLFNVARTIGSTLGTLAAKTSGESKPSKHSIRPVLAKKTRSKAVKTRNKRNA